MKRTEPPSVRPGPRSTPPSSDRRGAADRRAPAPLGLEEILRSLPEKDLGALAARLRIQLDDAKRLDAPSQVARGMLAVRELKDPLLLPAATRELLYRIVESGGVLHVDRLPPAVEPLIGLGIVFARASDSGGAELLVPVASMLQLPQGEGEDPRSFRVLMTKVAPDVASSIAAQYLGRPATPPTALALEDAYRALTNPQGLASAVAELAALERLLLDSVEDVGGEVATDELLDLEREPMRLRGAATQSLSRRGVGFALERRGFLVPIGPNRHVIPAEVAAVVGAARRAERAARRDQVLARVRDRDYIPHRARFAVEPAPLTLAIMLTVRDSGIEIRDGVGTPRSLVARLATRFGQPVETTALLTSLGRAAGLLDGSVMAASAPPGSLPVDALTEVLFDAWRRGGAWDDARSDGELLRAPVDQREASPTAVLRDVILDALAELGTGTWALWSDVVEYLRADSRLPGVERLLERWAGRLRLPRVGAEEVAHRIAHGTLHRLGVVDLGDPDGRPEDLAIRLTGRGRRLLGDGRHQRPPNPSRFVDNSTIRIGPATIVGHVAALAPFVQVAAVEKDLDLAVTARGVNQALSAGLDGEYVRERIALVAEPPDPVLRMLAQASAVLGRGDFVAASGFLWVDDAELRALLSTSRATSDLFVTPSPPGGLLVGPGIELDKVARRCRAVGVEVRVEGEVWKARGSSASRTGSSAGGAPPRAEGSRAGRSSAARAAARSSGAVPAVRAAPPSTRAPGRPTPAAGTAIPAPPAGATRTAASAPSRSVAPASSRRPGPRRDDE